MKLKSGAGYGCLIKDIDKTAEFYQKLGLEIKERSSDRLIIYLNWYRIDFFSSKEDLQPEFQKDASIDAKGAGVFFYFSVDDVDATYKEMLSLGLKPANEPKDQRWGNREFTICDPDGYKIVIFKRKVAKNPLDQ